MNFEKPLIGCMLLDSSCIDAVRVKVSPSHFASTDCSEIFRAICDLSDKGESCDILNVSEEATKDKYKTGPHIVELITDCFESCPSAVNADSYADRVLDDAKMRAVRSVANVAETAESGAEAVEEAIRQLNSLSMADKSNTKSMNEGINDLIERLEGLHNGNFKFCSTGLIDFDKQLDGGYEAGLHLIGARPSMGKTALVVNMAAAALKQNYAVKIYTMEMPTWQIVWRLNCNYASIPVNAKRNMGDEDWAKITAAIHHYKDANIEFDDSSGYGVSYLYSGIRAFAQEHENAVIYIDYLQLMEISASSNNRNTGIGEITRKLKRISKETDTPVILLSQLNRSLEQRPNKRPMMADLRESGEIEQDADTITFIYRDEVYNEDSPDKGITELIVAKNREGETGTVRVRSNLIYSRFENLAHEVYAK